MNRSRLVLLFWAVVLAAPIFVVSLSWLTPQWSLLQHFVDTLLSDMLVNTLVLLVGVAVGAGILGTGLAWLVTLCDFPGRRWFEWLFFLPFVLPAYVVAFVYLGLFDFAGPIQSFLREMTSFKGIDVRTGSASVILVFTLVFYPYVYMLARIGFQSQRYTFIEAGQTLGASSFKIFWKVSLPLARPSIVAGITLALMETLSDFGVVSIFNYDTFTTVIYSAWEDYRSVEVAAQVASLLVLFSFLLIFAERYSRGRAKFYTDQCLVEPPYRLKGWQALLASVVSILVVTLAFALPVTQLLIWAWQNFAVEWGGHYWNLIWNSLLLGVMAAVMAVAVALLLLSIKYRKRERSRTDSLLLGVASMGYALPGSVMAIGLLFVFMMIDRGMQHWFGIEALLLVSGGLGVLLYAYLSRFIAVALGPVEGAFESVQPSYVEAAQTMGAGRFTIFRRVYLPLVLPGAAVAFLMVAVDVMKELPATYLLRPYGWDTLAIQVYELAAEGLYERAALPSLALIAISLLILWGVKRIEYRR
ncbi:iron ABC transporter permease [Thiomicrorhabdus sp. zzn3]|uniref:ABC transporter permease n=1 Tax=Thiomicrorhabdus sp. zzn3 TaxID=3039775 RepID=UPI00243676D9|nr:iron ABC transporter permease [Thiomicrorhabdus sp. zzn3]MDG6779159.1 iron ABC transporter permease [Thiomicrorhabdus sp. zzn3]